MKQVKGLILILAIFIVASCGNKEEVVEPIKVTKNYIETKETTDNMLIEMENGDQLLIELYPDIAPISVKNFQKLVSENYYDGLIFHRVIEDFMIQTGDPTGTGTGGSEKTIKGEFEINGVENSLSHTRGVISMARRGSSPETEETMNSASSQFFIVHQDAKHLDGKYAAFGQVIDGIETVDRIAEVETDDNDKPIKEQKIKSIIFVEIEKN